MINRRYSPWFDRKRKRKNPNLTSKNHMKSRRAQFFMANRTKIEVGSWNVEGKGSPEDIDKLLTGSIKGELDVVCLQRANLPAPNTETSNYKWFCGGTSGSAILIKKSSEIVSKSFEKFSDNICMTEVTGKNDLKINIISCYIPPATDYTSEEAWTKLKEVIGSISHMLYILAGDFNAQIGKNDTQFTSQLQKRLYHEASNENGKKLSDLMRKCHFVLILSLKKYATECYTFSDGNLKSQQSYIFVPFSRQTFAFDDKIVRFPEYSHALLCYRVICRSNEISHFEPDKENSAKKPQTVVGCWNIQSNTPAKIDSVLNELNMPIVCIQELFLTSDEDIKTDNYTWLCTKKLWAKNVGILIKKSPNIELSKFEPLSEYLCVATVLFHGEPLTIVSLHLPAVSDSQHEQVVTLTKEQIRSITEESFIILGGDFSSVINSEGHICNSDEFVSNLAKETNLGFVDHPRIKADPRSMLYTHVTEAGKYRTSYVLVSQSAHVKSCKVELSFRWIPFFEHGIIYFEAQEKVDPQKKFNFDTIKVLEKPAVEVHMSSENNVKNKTVIHKYFSRELDSQEDITGLVSAEDREKFKNTPPSAEDLSRLFKDLVVFQGASRKSNPILTPFGILTKSLIDCKVGGFIVENITETEGARRSICRIKWNGIILAEETGKLQERHQNLLRKASQSIIAKLSQTCYTVKAKKSFFNRGMQPILMGTPDLDGIIKTVNKSLFPTMEDVYKHIDDFISEDTDAELLFGQDFSLQELFDISQYAYNKSGVCDFRFFKSENDTLGPIKLAVFRKRSPQYLRDLLIKEPKNVKYFLIPPCGLGVDYLEFHKNIVTDVSKEESKIWSAYHQKEQNQKVDTVVHSSEKPKDSVSSTKKTTQKSVPKLPNSQSSGRTISTSIRKNPFRSQQNIRSQNLGRMNLSRNSLQNVRTQSLGGIRSVPRRPSSQQNLQSQYSGRSSFLENSPHSQQNQRPQQLGRSSYVDHSPRSQQYQRSQQLGRSSYVENSPRSQHNQRSQELGGRKRDYSTMNSNQIGLYQSNPYFDISLREGDYRMNKNQGDSYGSNRYLETSGRELDYDFNQNGRNQCYEPILSNKRQKFDDMRDDGAFFLELPDWSNIRPLLIVWPITVRSQLEERPEEVLTENFTVQFKTSGLHNQSLTAVFVTLTHYDGSGRMYCIAKGSSTRHAAGVALDLLVKHCTIIKPNPTFLCDGLTPSFIRYKIPCQLYPRTYLILDRAETGPLSLRVIDDLISRFINSCEDDIYFDRSYSLDEKLEIIEQVPKIAKQKVMVRHFGDSPKLIDRYICIYKSKPKHQILEDVLKMRGEHPRYIMTVNRLPPGMDSMF